MTCCRCGRARTPQWQATRLVLIGLAVLAAAIFVAVRYEAQVARVNWSIVTGVCGAAFMVYLFWRWASDPESTLEPLDLILDPTTLRVSLWRVLIVIAFAIGVWTMGQWVITGNVPPDSGAILTLYGTILGSLVAKVASGEWAEVKANRQPIPAPETPQPGPAMPFGTLAAEAATDGEGKKP